MTYTLELDADRPGKTIKRPTDVRSGLYCNSNLAEHQYSYDEAAATGRSVGFVFDRADGFWFLDIDGAYDGTAWSALAQELCAQLAGAAVEVSQSGTGLHLIGRGTIPPHASRNVATRLELYTHQRFCALTGTNAAGDASSDHSAAITAIVHRYFPHNAHGETAGWTAEPVPEYGGPADDTELLRAAMASGKKSAAAAFGTGKGAVTFSDLWLADRDKLAAGYPDESGNTGYNASSADAALASHLAYWTGKDCERIRSLMLKSGLARPKWDDRPEWLETTIMKACAVVKNVAQARPAVPPPGAVAAAPAPAPAPAGAALAGPMSQIAMALRLAGREYLSTVEQIAFFIGCVYVVSEAKIWIPSTGDMLDKARFDVVYAGHVFPIDGQNDKTTDSAFDAFTKSRVFEAPRVDRTCFRPEYPAGAIIQEDGRSVVNTYIPITTKRIAGDASRVVGHLHKMLPHGRDAEILLHYMARCIRSPGFKSQWWPVIQGCEGNGKSLCERLMAFCVGSRYSHLVNVDAMAKTGNQFNKWIQGTLFVGFEEIYVANRRDFLESIKATVTNDRLPIEGKGLDQTTGDNRANALMLTNHRDGVPVGTDNRRYAIFFCEQQKAADLERDGMGGAYFPDLYDWLYGRGEYAHLGVNYGFAVMNDYLHTYELKAELDPARLCVRAPTTTSTADALTYGLGRAEQEIIEAIAEGRAGFGGGWVSSLAVDRLLETIRAPVARNKRKELLEALGYVLHPALPDGRVTGTVAPDNAKPRLYVKVGHLALELTDPLAIAKAYTSAQSTADSGAASSRFGAK